MRLDSCKASSLYADSAITLLLKQRADLYTIIEYQNDNIQALNQISEGQDEQAELLGDEIKKQKKRKLLAFFKGAGVGGVIVLILVLL